MCKIFSGVKMFQTAIIEESQNSFYVQYAFSTSLTVFGIIEQTRFHLYTFLNIYIQQSPSSSYDSQNLDYARFPLFVCPFSFIIMGSLEYAK